jgi:hypothetical protein
MRCALPLFEIASVVVCFDHVASFVVNANYSVPLFSRTDRRTGGPLVDNLRIAAGLIMPRIPTGNTMAPCVIIGERAAEILHAEHKLETSVIQQDKKSHRIRTA